MAGHREAEPATKIRAHRVFGGGHASFKSVARDGRTGLRAVLAGLALVLTTGTLPGCREAPPIPVIGTATSPGMQDAIVLGLAYGAARHPHLVYDTVFRLEPSGVADQALAVARELAKHPGVVAVIGHAGSSGTLLAAPVYREAGLLQLAPTASSPLLEESGPLTLRLVPSDREQGRLLGELARNDPAAEDGVALVWVNDEYGRGLRDAALQVLADGAVRVALDLPYSQTSGRLPDPEETAALLEASGAGILLVLGRATVLDPLLEPLRRRLGPIPVLGPDGLGLGTGVDGGRENPHWDGVRYLDFVLTTGTPELDAFRDAWQARTGRSDLPGGMILARDAAVLLIEGLAEGMRDGEALAAWLRNLPPDHPVQDHLLGGPVRFDPSGAVTRNYHLRRIGGDILSPPAAPGYPR